VIPNAVTCKNAERKAAPTGICHVGTAEVIAIVAPLHFAVCQSLLLASLAESLGLASVKNGAKAARARADSPLESSDAGKVSDLHLVKQRRENQAKIATAIIGTTYNACTLLAEQSVLQPLYVCQIYL
jgi:hypothetical protein